MCLPLAPKERFLKAVREVINADRRYPGSAVRTVFRFLGSPRAWQLGREQLLLELSIEDRQWLINAAVGVLAEALPGEKYFHCAEPQVLYDEAMLELMPPWDMKNVALIEEWYYFDTMPIEFVERVAALGKTPEHKKAE